MDRRSRFNNPIRKLRTSNAKTQDELAVDLGVATETIRRWESGVDTPSDISIRKVAEYFAIKPEDLYDDLITWKGEAA